MGNKAMTCLIIGLKYARVIDMGTTAHSHRKP